MFLPGDNPVFREYNRDSEPNQEVTMARKYIDCRAFPSEMNCTLAMSANTADELLEAAVQHAVSVHGHSDSAELRAQLRGIFKDSAEAASAPIKA